MSKVQFAKGSKIFLPSHGVGTIVDIEKKNIMSYECEVFVISFPKEAMNIMIPRENIQSSGLRKLMSKDMLKKIDEVLMSNPRTQRGTWTSRLEKYRLVIASGVAMYLAEMLRDGYYGVNDPNRSYTEATIYQQALSNLGSEFAEVLNIPQDDAEKRILDTLGRAQGKSDETDDFEEEIDDFADIVQKKKEVNE
jgi:CarD family transcriptional regulator